MIYWSDGGAGTGNMALAVMTMCVTWWDWLCKANTLVPKATAKGKSENSKQWMSLKKCTKRSTFEYILFNIKINQDFIENIKINQDFIEVSPTKSIISNVTLVWSGDGKAVVNVLNKSFLAILVNYVEIRYFCCFSLLKNAYYRS